MMEEADKSTEPGVIPVPMGITLPLTFPEEYSFHHLLGYSWASSGPVLTMEKLIRDEDSLLTTDEVCEIDLFKMEEIDMVLSDTRACTGRWAEGGHLHCPEMAILQRDSQCYNCLSADFPDPLCLFEPHCNVGSCGASFCMIEHVVYLAVYHDRLKVGMTQLRRLQRRGIEQGADMITPIALLGDRYSARTLERMISSECSIPQSIHPSNHLRSMKRVFDEESATELTGSAMDEIGLAWERIEAVMSNNEGINLLTEPADMIFHPLRLEYPLPEPLETTPRRLKGNGLRGRIVGFKGSYMVIRSHGLHAFNMMESVGRIILCPEYI